MSAITKLLKNEETPLGRAVYFTHLHCTADKELGEEAAAELARLQAIEAAAQELIDDWKLYGNAAYRMCAKLEAALKKAGQA